MRKYSILFIIISFIVTLVLAGCAGAPTEPAATESQQDTDIDISEIETHAVGQEISTGNIVWEITEVEDLGNQLTYENTPGILEAEEGRFIGVTFSVHNTGEEDKMIYDLTAIDDKSRSYSICLAAFAFFTAEEACVLQQVLPGIENTYSATFDVATDAESVILQITDLEIPPQEVAYIDLDI